MTMDDHDQPGAPSSNFVIAGALSLAFTVGGCSDSTGYDDGFLDSGYDDTGYLDTGPLDTGPLDTGPITTNPSGYDEGWDEGYYYTDSFPTTDPTTEPGTASWTTTGIDTTTTDGTASSTTDITASTGTTTDSGTTGSSTTGTDSSTTDSSGTDSSGSGSSGSTGDTGGVDPNFPPLGVFGDDVTELDLVGTWSLQWTPDGTTWDSVLTIDVNGDFIWRENSADCSVDTLGTGTLWVEPGQIVMHVDTWERQLPWDTMAVAGQEFPPPFRLRMSYGLLGPNLGLVAPERIVEAEPFTGRAYLQDSLEGMYIAGTYIGEAELLAAFDGQPDAKVVVRDRWTADLDPEVNLNPESTGIVFRDRDVAGKLVAVDTVAAAVKAMAIPREGVRIAHRILRVRADCPSSDCSWASIEFDREIHDGNRVEVVPMTATMLCRYAADAPHMRVFVWHAAPRVSR